MSVSDLEISVAMAVCDLAERVANAGGVLRTVLVRDAAGTREVTVETVTGPVRVFYAPATGPSIYDKPVTL